VNFSRVTQFAGLDETAENLLARRQVDAAGEAGEVTAQMATAAVPRRF